ncbi:MAG: SRPBCC family protein [Terrimicrobiaceae bacterium]
MLTFEASTLLNATPERVFEFHENPENIRRIAPQSLKVLGVECEKRAALGSKFQIKISQWGIGLEWVGIWEQVTKPALLVDIAEKSPFAFWRHSHIFEPSGAGCRMTDRVEYRLRGGALARIAERLILPVFFPAMFRARHRATRRFFAEPTGE